MINRKSFLTRLKRLLKKKIFFYTHKRYFGYIARDCEIQKPYLLDGTKDIFIKEKTFIAEGAWISAFKDDTTLTNNNPKVNIGKNVYIGRYSHIIAVGEMSILDSVMIADKVYISDNSHEFNGINIPIRDQKVLFIKNVTINTGAWIGENVCIIGASIGKNSVVAANSVVLKDVPDYTLVAGSPAKVIKRFNLDNQLWERVDC